MCGTWTLAGVAVLFAAALSFAEATAGDAATVEEQPADALLAWRIGERMLPPPAAASDRLRELIATAPAPDVAARRASAPADAAAWRAIVVERDRARTQPLDELGRNFGVRIARDTIAGVPVHRIEPVHRDPVLGGRTLLYLHGGAYVYGAGDAGVYEAALIAGRLGLPTVSVDYRMPPEHPAPAAVEDVVAVYRALAAALAPGHLAIGGTSAGGGLALTAVQRMSAEGLPVPGAIYAGTPWADLSKTGDTLYTNEGIDRALVAYEGQLEAAALRYAGSLPLTDPRVSPLYGDFSGFPPTWLVTGTRDLFLSDTVRVHRAVRRAGSVADLVVFEGLSHAEYLLDLASQESLDTYAELGEFLRRHLADAPAAR
jgi:acetyl esterase/lipase